MDMVRTHLGIPLQMFVNEPEGRDGRREREEARNNPADLETVQSWASHLKVV